MPEQPVQRKLVAILAADIAGYGRLVALDDAGILGRLKVFQCCLPEPAPMSRRTILAALGGAALLPTSGANAQRGAMPVIGFLGAASPTLQSAIANLSAFRDGLKETGYIEGQNVAGEYRWAEGHYERLPALAAELVERKVDLIATTGGTGPAHAAKEATSTIPIVFVTGDPVAAGLVASLNKPGGNLTPPGQASPSRPSLPPAFLACRWNISRAPAAEPGLEREWRHPPGPSVAWGRADSRAQLLVPPCRYKLVSVGTLSLN